MQPEQFGYDFQDWISPYTKGACTTGGLAIVLQDWASEDALAAGFNECIAALGRDPTRHTNRALERLLFEGLGTRLVDNYATNVFPYVKPGKMSAAVPQFLVNEMVKRFTVHEIRLAKPMIVLALGKVAQAALRYAGVKCVCLPHPAARIGGFQVHLRAWQDGFGQNQK